MNYLGGVVIACVLVCEVTAIAVKNDGGSKALYVFGWDGQKEERSPAKKELPTFKIKDGQEKVSLFKIYKVAKWHLGIPNSPSYIPDEGTEVYVLRFYREALSPGNEIAKHAVTVVDSKNLSLERNKVLWRISSGKWVEWVFLATRGTQLKIVLINDVSFDVEGLEILSEALPSEK